MVRLRSMCKDISRMPLRGKSLAIVTINGLLLWLLYQSAPQAEQREVPMDEESLRRYRPPPQANVETVVGRRLEVEATYLKPLLRDHLQRVKDRQADARLTREDVDDFVFVTAASLPFYTASLKAIATVQEHFPKRRIYFYDMEYGSGRRDDGMQEKISALCGVTYRALDFSKYPPHIRTLRYYAWKPMIVYEMLKEFRGVLWMDSSIRFVTSNLSTILDRATATGGIVSFTSTGHSNFAVTHRQMYAFLPTSLDGMKRSIQLEANCVLFHATRFVLSDVVWWWVLCALDPLCIAPIDKTSCEHPYASGSLYANCHRFDQSAINILLANHFAYEQLRYLGGDDVVKVHRMSDGVATKVHVCAPGKDRTLADPREYVHSNRAVQRTGVGLLPEIVAPQIKLSRTGAERVPLGDNRM